MQFFSPISYKGPEPLISYRDALLLNGSCFTEHIGNALMTSKFNVLQNPQGILFDVFHVAQSVVDWIENKPMNAASFFLHNDWWQSWQLHSRFAHADLPTAIAKANESRQQAHDYLKKATWLVLTLGSAFTYKINRQMPGELLGGLKSGDAVANCHKVPGKYFDKYLLGIDEMITALDTMLYRLFQFNPHIRVLFTVSPVRHLRDGVVENNRSKARLIETAHHLCHKFDRIFYFPAYELVIDVLRDYRFYDIDLAHPNYAATQYVHDFFKQHCLTPEAKALELQIGEINTARNHKPRNITSTAHRQFMEKYARKTQEMASAYPFIDLSFEQEYFLGALQ